MLSRSSASVLLLVTLQLALPPTGVSQKQSSETAVRVTVRAADTNRLLAGALVRARGIGMQGVTGPNGVAWLQGIQPGAHEIQARYLGYGTETLHVRVEPGRTMAVAFDLPIQPIRLAEVEVQVAAPILARNGFFDRRGSGFGTFITREQIERMRPRFLSDVLRRAGGISLTPSVGGTSRARMRGASSLSRDCPIQYYVDGTMVAYFNIDEVTPSDVEGLEIYRGAATVPPAFNKGSAMCGVVVIWTRIR
jgi:hypothetical protein